MVRLRTKTFREDKDMRRRMPLLGTLLVVLLALSGCTEAPPTTPIPTELVTLRLPFQETFADTEGAKRVVVCQFEDDREQKSFIGEGFVPGSPSVPRKFVAREDVTLVLPRVFGSYLKHVGFNVVFAERLPDVRSEVVRGVLQAHKANHLVTGRLEEYYVRARPYAGQPVMVLLKLRLDVYNEKGRLRTYYPGRISDSEFLGDKAGDPAEIAAFVNRAVQNLYVRSFEEAYFVRTLDLELETVQELMKAKPVIVAPEAVEVAPEVVTPEPAPPRELTEEEKLELERQKAARELEEAIRKSMEE